MKKKKDKTEFNQGDIRINKKIIIGDKVITWINQLNDGNCLFRALSYCLFGDCKFHWNLRVLIVNYIRLNKEKYINIFENGYFELDDEYFSASLYKDIFNNYVNYMSISNIQGGQLELIVLNDIINSWNSSYTQPIIVYSIYNHKLINNYIGKYNLDNPLLESSNPLLLYHKAHNHYWGGLINSPKSDKIYKLNFTKFKDMYISLKNNFPKLNYLFNEIGDEFDYIEDINLIRHFFQ